MPCSEKRARILLSKKRAVIHKMMPFTIRIKDRLIEKSIIKKYRKEIQKRGAVDGDLYMMNGDEVVVPYARILIRRKK